MISEGKYKIFDSHSRDLYGIPDLFGKCLLIAVEGLDNFAFYFQSSYRFMCSQNTALPFEIKAVKLSNSDNTIIRNNDYNLTDNECVSQNHNELKEKERRLMKRREKYKETIESESTESREKRGFGCHNFERSTNLFYR